MPIKALLPRHGDDTFRIGDSDDLVVMENTNTPPDCNVVLKKHALIILCTKGMVQFDYEGQQIQMRKGDLFINFKLRSVAGNFKATPDFSCRQIWFVRDEAWNIDMYAFFHKSSALNPIWIHSA